MEVRTISCSKKITAELAINIDTIEYHSSSIHGNSFELPFSICVGDGSNYNGKIVLNKKYLFCYVYNVKSLTGIVSMMISKGKLIYQSIAGYVSQKIANTQVLDTLVGADPVTFLKGSFTITFEPNEKKFMEESLINSFSILKQDQLEGSNDVTLVSGRTINRHIG